MHRKIVGFKTPIWVTSLLVMWLLAGCGTQPAPAETPTVAAGDPAAAATSSPPVVQAGVSVTVTPEISPAEDVTSTETSTVVEAGPVALELTTGIWLLFAIDGVQVLGGLPVTATFAADGALSGTSGCNDYTAQYSASAGRMSVSGLTLLTGNPCRSDEEADEEAVYLGHLGTANTYTLQGLQLALCSADSFGCLQYISAAALTVDGTTWVVGAYQSEDGLLVEPLADGPVLTAIFQDSIVQGYGGCDNFEGLYIVEGDSFQLEQVVEVQAGVQGAGCALDLVNQQAFYLKALELTKQYRLEGLDLSLLDGSGKPVVIYTAAKILQ
jgi:heat shock protein HslJ